MGIDLGNWLTATRREAVALARAARVYATGVKDPNDKALITATACQNALVCRPTPVVLVHGFLHNWSAWGPLMTKLRAAGYIQFLRFNYSWIADSPIESAGALAHTMREVFDVLDVDRAHFVGHSLGGVVIRQYTGALGGGATLGHAVTLGSPLAGTAVAAPFPWLPEAIEDLKPESPFVRRLQGYPIDTSEWTCLAADEDLLVPPEGAGLPGVAVESFSGLGHLGMLHDDAVLDRVVQALVTADTPASGPAGITLPGLTTTPTIVLPDSTTHGHALTGAGHA